MGVKRKVYKEGEANLSKHFSKFVAAVPCERAGFPPTTQARVGHPGLPALPVRHLLSHVQQQAAIGFFNASQQTPELVEEARLFAAAAPGDIVCTLSLGQIGQFGRFFAVVEELVEWNLESSCELFECFDGRYSVAVLNTRNVTPEKSGALFDVPL